MSRKDKVDPPFAPPLISGFSAYVIRAGAVDLTVLCQTIRTVAMDVAMRYEHSRGWTPTDVSQDGEHYDIRSEGPSGEKRFIEVKGRAQSGAIVLTGPEMDKLRQLGERAWLYVVTFCKGKRPRLRVIQDPISRLKPEMLYRQIQFVVEEGDWAQQGEEVLAPDSSEGGDFPATSEFGNQERSR